MIRKNSTRVKMLLLLVTTIAFGVRNTTAQVKIGDNKASVDARSILELESTTKALYLPRLSTAQINAQSGWKAGMMVYNTDSACVQHFTTKWQCLASVSTDADNQDLSIVGDSLKITGGTGVLLSDLGTDDQNLSIANDSLLIEDGAGVLLSDLGTDDQNLSIANDSLLIEDGAGVLLSDLGTDDQNISGSGINTTSNILTIGIESGNNETVDLSHLDDAGTDDQNLSIANDSLLIEDGTGVLLSDLGTDDQKIDTFQINGDSLELSVEDDGEAVKTVALNDIAREPWFGDDDDAAATTNTEDIYHMGNVGIGTTAPTNLVHLNTTSTATDNYVLKLESNPSTAGRKNVGMLFTADDGGGGGYNLASIKSGFLNSTSWNNARLYFGVGAGMPTRMTIQGNGHVGIGTEPGGFRLNVQGGQQRWSSSTANTNHVIDFSTPGGHTGFVFNTTNAGNRSRFDIRNYSNATVGNRYFAMTYNGEQGLFIRKGGNVGIRRTDPSYNLDVNGSFRNVGNGLFTVMNGNDGNMTGASKRGIFLWNDSDPNWGIYMARSGGGRALDGDTAAAGVGFNQHAIRFRANNNNTQGFIFENTADQNLFSIRGSDGYAYFNDQVRINELTAGAATDEIVVADATGVLKKRATTDIVQEPWFGDDDDAAATSNTEDIYHMGNVGINVTDPSDRLDVGGNISLGRFANNSAGGINRSLFLFGNSGTLDNYGIKMHYPSGGQWGPMIFTGSATGRSITFGKSGTAWEDDNMIEWARFLDGDLGIGTTAPQEKLDVVGNAEIGTAGEEMHIGDVGIGNWAGIAHKSNATSTNYALIQNNAGRTILNAKAGQVINFRQGNVDKMIINASGNVGIRMTNPSYSLDVNGSFKNNGNGLFTVMNGSDGNMTGATKRGIFLWDDTDHNWGIYMSRSGAGRALDGGTAVAGTGFTNHAVRFRTYHASNNGFIFENSVDQNLMSIRASDGFTYVRGNMRIGGLSAAGNVQSDANGNLSVSSDERLKNITANFSRGLEAILGLQPISYKWNQTSGLDMENTYTGFSAQNVQANIPEAVGQDDRGFLTLSDRPIIGALVNSVKELKTENDTLKAENEDLKQRLAKIEATLGIK